MAARNIRWSQRETSFTSHNLVVERSPGKHDNPDVVTIKRGTVTLYMPPWVARALAFELLNLTQDESGSPPYADMVIEGQPNR